MTDLWFAVGLIALATLLALAYTTRRAFRGPSFHKRVREHGASPLLSMNAMEGAYWSLDPVASLCLALGISANALTWTSLLFGTAAAVALADGWLGLGAVLASASALLDALDGTVARALGTSSDAGEVLDAALDRYTEFLFLAGLVIHYRGSVWLLGLVLGAIIASFMISYSTAKAEALHVCLPRGIMRRAERAVWLIIGAALSPVFAALGVADNSVISSGELPMIAALALIAIAGNVSAANRMRLVMREVSPPPSLPAGETGSDERPASQLRTTHTSR